MEPIFLTIFHTNDMHARIDAILRLSSLIRRSRTEAENQGRLTFLWDAGDAADRRSRLCSITKGATFSSILNAMGYDLQTMGNAIALPYGPQAITAVAERANFPILAANCRDGDGPLPEGLEEYAIIPLPNSLQMGVIGLTSPWDGLYEIFGLAFPDFCEVAKRLVTELKRAKISPIIVLSHLGLAEDRRLAREVPGIDLIIGGHSHDLLPNGEEVNSVLIAQAGDYAKALGRIDLVLDPSDGSLKSCSAQVLTVQENEEPDPVVMKAIAAAEREVDELMLQPIGMLETALDLDYFHECDIGNLTADVLRLRMKADAAIISSGLFHNGLPKGVVTLGDLDQACFSTANPCLTSFRGNKIKQALERGLDPTISHHHHHGFRGTPIGIPQVSGMMVEFDPHAETGKRVTKITIQGEPLRMEGIYQIAHTDAEAMSEYGYFQLDEGQHTEHEVPTIVREAIEDYFRQHTSVPQPIRERWRSIS